MGCGCCCNVLPLKPKKKLMLNMTRWRHAADPKTELKSLIAAQLRRKDAETNDASE
jgi:hypothetical protein